MGNFQKKDLRSANPTKWSKTLKQFVGCFWRIAWECSTILWVWRLKGYNWVDRMDLLLKRFRLLRPWFAWTSFTHKIRLYTGIVAWPNNEHDIDVQNFLISKPMDNSFHFCSKKNSWALYPTNYYCSIYHKKRFTSLEPHDITDLNSLNFYKKFLMTEVASGSIPSH